MGQTESMAKLIYTPEQCAAVVDASMSGASPVDSHRAAVKLGARIQDGPYDVRPLAMMATLMKLLDRAGWEPGSEGLRLIALELCREARLDPDTIELPPRA